jgi:hypothetical protein
MSGIVLGEKDDTPPALVWDLNLILSVTLFYLL